MLDETLKLLQIPGVLGAVITGAIAVGIRYFQPASKIWWGTSHRFTFFLPPNRSNMENENLPAPPIQVETQSIFISNKGRIPAKDIEIIFNYPPQHFSMWPKLNYKIESMTDNRFVIKFDTFSLGEFTTIELINVNQEMPAIVNVHNGNGVSKEVKFIPMRLFPIWFNAIGLSLMVIGFYQSIVFLFNFVGYPHK